MYFVNNPRPPAKARFIDAFARARRQWRDHDLAGLRETLRDLEAMVDVVVANEAFVPRCAPCDPRSRTVCSNL